MTKSIAELTGSVSAFSAGVALVLAVLITPLNLPSFQIPTQAETRQGEVSSVQESTSSAPTEKVEMVVSPIVEPEENEELSAKVEMPILPDRFGSDPTVISGINKACLSASLYGVVSEEEAKEAPSTLSSLVLSDHVSEQELGTFGITYQVTPEEYEMLLFCVEFETRSGCLEHKSLIAQVIMNRVQGEKFPFTVAEVLTAPGQFDVMPGYEECTDWEPSEVTRQAVDMVLSGVSPDYAQGALYFCNPYIVGEGNWFDTSLQVICEIEGHRFYKPY